MSFKVGDKVKCVSINVDKINGHVNTIDVNKFAEESLKVGNIYTVTSVFSKGNWVSIEESRYNHPIEYFELYKEPKKKVTKKEETSIWGDW